MKILFAASEASPFIATGGLGDVAGSLPAALAKVSSADVRVVIPLYPRVKEKYGSAMTLLWYGEINLAWRRQYMGIFELSRGDVTYYFIDNEYYFRRESCYGNFDDGERFAYFSAAVIELMEKIDFFPDVLHANDWQTALVPVYLRLWHRWDKKYDHIRTVYTIHNISYQGVYSHELLWDVFGIWEEDRGILDYNGALNLTKGAIVAANEVTTVSPTYASEILTEHYSAGLNHILWECRGKLRGIINGIDTEKYNPATDKNLIRNYSPDHMSGKAECRRELCRICGFDEDSDLPVIAMVSRLAGHKGFELVERVIGEMLWAGDARFVLLGCGERHFEDFFLRLSGEFPGSFYARIAFDSALASKIYAGADMFLMPSKSEPCGLAQMIASAYGTIPIVRETGGLYDTIKPYRDDTGEGNGFTFACYNAHDMMYTIRRAASVYKQKEIWKTLMARAMRMDFSWNVPAEEYIRLYRSIIK